MPKNYKIKKSIVLIIAIFLISVSLFSNMYDARALFAQVEENQIDVISANNVANKKLLQLGKTNYVITNTDEVCNAEGKILFYVFHLMPQGYIVISAYRNLPPVIAYSFYSSFEDQILENNILKDILIADIELRLANIPRLPDELIERRTDYWNKSLSNKPEDLDIDYFQQWPPEGITLSGGWVETQWHQNAPYNNFCPIDMASGDRGVAGCPAVAMAQILNYHETINNIAFNDTDDYFHSYAGNSFWIDNDHGEYDFPSFPELNNYLDVLVDHWRNDIQLTDNDKAAINFACGVAATQVYHPQGSGTFGVSQAYDAYQRFNFEGIELLGGSDPDLYNRLSANIMDALPAHLAIVNEQWDAGHNLVVDGYNTEGFYHLNFGWGGSYDGWYLLPDDLPYELTVIEGVIVDIRDDNSGSNLDGNGALYWTNIKPASTVTGSFSIENIGLPSSEIDWEIVVWPDWGTWTFNPSSGEDLTPEDGPITIDVEVEVPNLKKHFNGHVKIVNKDNLDDYCMIHVSLTTPYNKNIICSPFLQILCKLIECFPYLEQILTFFPALTGF